MGYQGSRSGSVTDSLSDKTKKGFIHKAAILTQAILHFTEYKTNPQVPLLQCDRMGGVGVQFSPSDLIYFHLSFSIAPSQLSSMVDP